jgi:hypothetical protein
MIFAAGLATVRLIQGLADARYASVEPAFEAAIGIQHSRPSVGITG